MEQCSLEILKRTNDSTEKASECLTKMKKCNCFSVFIEKHNCKTIFTTVYHVLPWYTIFTYFHYKFHKKALF